MLEVVSKLREQCVFTQMTADEVGAGRDALLLAVTLSVRAVCDTTEYSAMDEFLLVLDSFWYLVRWLRTGTHGRRTRNAILSIHFVVLRRSSHHKVHVAIQLLLVESSIA